METSTSAREQSDTRVGDTDGEPALQARIEELRDRLQVVNERVKAFIMERPAACLVGAMALGYLVARIARRRG